MSPRFAQQVDSIFMRVIDLLESIDGGGQPAAEQERRIINDLLWQAETELGRTDGMVWELAKYALVAWIDESLLNATTWSGRDWWLSNTMEWEHFRSAECHEMFYVKANEAANLPGGNDALETYYVCAMLGFRGLYAADSQGEDAERVELAVRRFSLPRNLTAWAGNIAQVMKQRQTIKSETADAEAPERSVITAQPLWGRAQLLWPWLLAALLAGLNVVVWYRQSH